MVNQVAVPVAVPVVVNRVVVPEEAEWAAAVIPVVAEWAAPEEAEWVAPEWVGLECRAPARNSVFLIETRVDSAAAFDHSVT